MTYAARPLLMGSWRFELREGGAKGPVAARVELRGLLSGDGRVVVRDVPFEIDREGMGRAYRLVFEGRALARAVPRGLLSNAYDLTVEAGILDSGVPVGERVQFTWVPRDLGGGTYELMEGEERLGRVEKTSFLFRHYTLHFDDEVPLALQGFCLALLLARLRRQSSG